MRWVRATAHHEDTSQDRTGQVAHAMASLHHLTIGIHQLASRTNFTATLRHYGRDLQVAADFTRL